MIYGKFFYHVPSEPMIDEKRGGTFIEIIEAAAFRQSVESGADVCLRMEHLQSIVLACVSRGTLRLRTDDVALSYEADLPHDDYGADAENKIDDGRLFISPTFKYGDFRSERDSSGIEQRRVKRAVLHDLSLVDRPAYRMPPVQRSRGRQLALETRGIERGGYCLGVLGAGPSLWRE